MRMQAYFPITRVAHCEFVDTPKKTCPTLLIENNSAVVKIHMYQLYNTDLFFVLFFPILYSTNGSIVINLTT